MNNNDLYVKSGFEIVKAVISSSINILALLIIAGSLIAMAQGHVLPIALFENTIASTLVNLTLLHILLGFLAVLMTFYPIYIYTVLFDTRKKKWFVERFGLLLYENESTDVDVADKTSMPVEKIVRLSFGAMIFCAWIIAILLIVKSVHQNNLIIYGAIATIFGMAIFFTIIFGHEKYKIISTYKSNIYYITYCVFILQLMLALTYRWGYVTFITEIVISFLAMLSVIFFRLHRSAGKLTDVNFLHYIRCAGLFFALIILITNVSDDAAMFINPINHLLLLIITVYTIFIIIIKGLIYLKYCYDVGKISKFRFRIVLSTFTLLVLGFMYNLNHGNNLHTLDLVEYKTKQNLDDFYLNYKNNYNSTCPPIFYSAYGGGLMANYWNLLMFKEFQKEPVFLSNTVALSGVSGGSMGIANYMASKYSNTNIEKSIFDVGKANILGLELSWFYGWDYIREGLPDFLVFGKDRSNRSMSYYAKIYGNKNLVSDIALDSIYDALTAGGKHFPNPIFNSTTPTYKYGVATVIGDNSSFPGSIMLNQLFPDRELAFFESASTSNRFPIISPAANIENVGHFLDGGYFENSAVLSNISFKKRLERLEDEISTHSSLFDKKVRLVTIRNSKDSYIAYLMSKYIASGKAAPTLLENKDYTEVGAVLSGVTNIERMPNYIASMAKTNFIDEYDLVEICLPYVITKSDIEQFLGGKFTDGFWSYVIQNNDTIRNILDTKTTTINGIKTTYNTKHWGIVNPPTSRYLSYPVEIYMKIMAEHHPDVKSQLYNSLN